MTEVLKSLGSFLRKILKTEMKSIAGRFNLAGGLLLVIFSILAFVNDLIVIISNAVLSYYDKTPLPTIPGYYLLAALVILAVYFNRCVMVLDEAEK